MISRRRWILSAAVAVVATACAGILEPDRERTGVIEHVAEGSGGNVLLRDVRGDQYNALILGLPDELEILVKGPGGVFQPGPRSVLQPGVRIRFERTDHFTLLITPPGFFATKIWVLGG